MKKHHLYLASASPRRRELLEQIGISYSLIIPDIDESIHNEANPKTYTERIAKSKALFAQAHIEKNNLATHAIIAADTAVVINHFILGKPTDKDHALEMLTLLSGKLHQVYSSICFISDDKISTTTQISEVTFKVLSKKEMMKYWQSGEPADKAGAYGIQGLGAKFITHLSGSYSGVMGLPLYELQCLLDNKPHE